jgi:cysteinyl-tRNA synthetase
MVRVSGARGLTIKELTDSNHQIYLDEMSALNILAPNLYPRVSETIPEIITAVADLVEKEVAYLRDGYIFFDSDRQQSLGELIGLTNTELLTFESDSMPAEPEELKRSPLDFLIWQPSSHVEASFESPWGVGRPGWHIECSVMAQTHLGDRLDIHGGGKDLRYPHHASEIAQSEASTGKTPYVSYWMHNGTMQLDGVKMSKSLGNLVKVSDLLQQEYSGNAVRLSLAQVHYRQDRDYDSAALAKCEELITLFENATLISGPVGDPLSSQPYRSRFQAAMDNDLDSPTAANILTELANAIIEGEVSSEAGRLSLIELAMVLGVDLEAD